MVDVPKNINMTNLDDVHVCDVEQEIVYGRNTSHAQRLMNATPTYPVLSDAEEQEIVVQYCYGTSIRDIARQLHHSVSTIRAYLTQVGLLTTLDGNHEIPCVMVKRLT
jgi:DNA-binding NarL/FixJ family response regulator